jgi:hypothetical protein
LEPQEWQLIGPGWWHLSSRWIGGTLSTAYCFGYPAQRLVMLLLIFFERSSEYCIIKRLIITYVRCGTVIATSVCRFILHLIAGSKLRWPSLRSFAFGACRPGLLPLVLGPSLAPRCHVSTFLVRYYIIWYICLRWPQFELFDDLILSLVC